MIKFKLFFKSTEKEEEWIDKVQKSGYTLQALTHFFQPSIILREIKKKTRCQ